MKNLNLTIIIILLAFNLQAQYKLELGGSLGATNGYLIPLKNYVNQDQNIIIPSYSYQFTVGNSYSFKNNILNIDLSYIVKKNNKEFDNQKSTYKYDYIILPIYYGIQKNKFTFNFGFTNNFSLNVKNVPSEFFIKKYNISLLLGSSYKINNRLSIKTDVLHDITPYNNSYYYIGNNRSINGYFFMYNIMIGLKYAIIN